MKKKFFLTLFVILAFFFSISNDEKRILIKSTELYSTLITFDLKTNIVNDKNLIFCSTIFNLLNKVEQRINNKTNINLLSDNEQFIESKLTYENNIAIYANLRKKLSFFEPFENLKIPIKFFIGDYNVSVLGFGIENYNENNYKHKLLIKQFEVIYFNLYDRTNKFIVKLFSTESDEIILSTAFVGKTLYESYEMIQNKVDNKKEFYAFAEKSTIQIPKINFSISHLFNEFTGKKINQNIIESVIQDISFKLDENGSTLWSFSTIHTTKSTGLNIIFNSPFILYIKKKKESLPYFMLYIANDELLSKR